MYLTSSGAGVLGTFLPNLSAALSWGIVAGSVSEPGRNQEESGEKLLRKLMRSQVFSEVFIMKREFDTIHMDRDTAHARRVNRTDFRF